jgi:hypothetical protein
VSLLYRGGAIGLVLFLGLLAYLGRSSLGRGTMGQILLLWLFVLLITGVGSPSFTIPRLQDWWWAIAAIVLQSNGVWGSKAGNGQTTEDDLAYSRLSRSPRDETYSRLSHAETRSSLPLPYGYSLRGQLAFLGVPTDWGTITTRLVNMRAKVRVKGMRPPMDVESSTIIRRPESSAGGAALSGLRAKVKASDDGQPYGVRRPDRVRWLIGDRGAVCSGCRPARWSLVLQRGTLSKVGSSLHHVRARTGVMLVEASDKALDAIRPRTPNLPSLSAATVYWSNSYRTR